MKLKKFVSVLLVVLTLAFGMTFLAACQQPDPPETPGGETGGGSGGSTTVQTTDVSVYAPDGAPALALAQLMSEDMTFSTSSAKYNVDYNVVAPTTIQTYVSGNNQADLCVLPINAAAKVLGTGSTYKMLGVVTHGNIFIITADGEAAQLTTENLSSLIGKKVGSIQLGNVVGLTLKLVLQQNDIPYVTGTDPSAAADPNAVNLYNITDPTTISPALPYDYMVAAEPVISAKTSTGALKVVGNLQTLYGEGGYPQAVLVAKADFINGNKAFVEAFIEAMQENVDWLAAQTTSAETVIAAIQKGLPDGASPTFNAKNLTKTVIANCSIRFDSAADSKQEVKDFLAKLSEVAGETYTVSDNFFYAG